MAGLGQVAWPLGSEREDSHERQVRPPTGLTGRPTTTRRLRRANAGGRGTVPAPPVSTVRHPVDPPTSHSRLAGPTTTQSTTNRSYSTRQGGEHGAEQHGGPFAA